MLGALSSIYDKYLLQQVGIDAPTLQAWFSVYLVPMMLPLAIRWRLRDRQRVPFHWRRTIPWISITLLLADFAYFTALHQPDALVSLISPLRRTSVVIPFLLGVLVYKEKGFRLKAICLAGLLFGVFILAMQ